MTYTSWRPPFSYSGGKTEMVNHIINRMQHYFPNERHLGSVFLGAGAIELRLMYAFSFTCAGNDADTGLVNFWHHARHNAEEIVSVARSLLPIDRETFEAWVADMRDTAWTTLEEAAKFFIMRHCRIVHNWSWWDAHATRWMEPTVHNRFLSRFAHFKAPRLEVVCQDFRDFLSETDSLLYVDSPYFSERGEMEAVYEGGTVGTFTKEDHEDLASLLLSRKGWIASNANSPWVRERYADVLQVEINSTKYASRNFHKGDRTAEELLLISPL